MFGQKELKTIRRVLNTPCDPDDIDAIDRGFCSMMAPHVDRFSKRYFRLEVEGLDDVPDGPALVVGNHNSGVGFFEALGVGARWFLERGQHDILHGLGHDAVVTTPYVGRLASRAGVVRASHQNANAIFSNGRKCIVFPGGNREAFRPYRDRNKIAFGDRRGFIRLALRNSVPIIPAVFIGGHEGFFVLHDGQFIAKLLKLDRILRTDTWPLMLALPWGLGCTCRCQQNARPVFCLPFPSLPTPRKMPITKRCWTRYIRKSPPPCNKRWTKWPMSEDCPLLASACFVPSSTLSRFAIFP